MAQAEDTLVTSSQAEAHSRVAVPAPPASSTEIDLLRKRFETAEAATVAVGKERDELRTRVRARGGPACMNFRSMLPTDCQCA